MVHAQENANLVQKVVDPIVASHGLELLENDNAVGVVKDRLVHRVTGVLVGHGERLRVDVVHAERARDDESDRGKRPRAVDAAELVLELGKVPGRDAGRLGARWLRARSALARLMASLSVLVARSERLRRFAAASVRVSAS